ncbi:H-NS histone family protein [Burkholderia stagnalis]
MRTYQELLEQLDQLQKEIDVVREYEAQRIAQRVLDVLAENGVDIRAMTASPQRTRRTRGKVEPKYWNPDTGATWSGRGRTPLWLVGEEVERFLIHRQDNGADSDSESSDGRK